MAYTSAGQGKSREGAAAMAVQLTQLRGACQGGTCPTVYATDRGTLVVQGAIVTDAEGVNLPAGETLVEVPAELLAGLKADR